MKNYIKKCTVANYLNIAFVWSIIHILYAVIFPEIENPHIFRNYIPGIVMLSGLIVCIMNELFIIPKIEKEIEG